MRFANRKELYLAGLHNSYMRGIGRAKDGSGNMSIVLSGGYTDDEDFGDIVIYTGEGGRDESTKKQISDQTISGGNRDLVLAFESNEPVYIIRGSKHKGPYSPDKGYEFAGIFYITEHWIEKGKDGYDILRFKLVKDSDNTNTNESEHNLHPQPARYEFTSQRIIRETKLAKQVKEIYGYKCQVCKLSINLPTGNMYVEAAHIKPLGKPHNGPDALNNLLSLCPNHHLMFDKYVYSVNPINYRIEGADFESLNVHPAHNISREYLEYHWKNYLAHKVTIKKVKYRAQAQLS